jgi:hypothetical protein
MRSPNKMARAVNRRGATGAGRGDGCGVAN